MNLNEIAPIIVEKIQKALSERRYPFGVKKTGLGNKIASGNLYNSVQATVVPNRQGTDVIEVSMADYAKWVQSGRAPGKRFVPIEPLLKWVKDRKLRGRDERGRYIKDISFAYAIQRNIYKFGIRPSNFIDVAIDDILEDDKITELLENATYEDLINKIEGI